MIVTADPLRILVIDDDGGDRALCRRMLKSAVGDRLRFMEADSGERGLDLIENQAFDCVLLDHSLPGLNGIEVLKRLRIKHAHLPVVMIDGKGNDVIAVQSMKEGAQDYLTKSTMTSPVLQRAVEFAIANCTLAKTVRSNEERFRSIFSAVSEGIIVVDAATGTFLEVNEACALMYGYSPGEMIGCDIEFICANVPPYTRRDALEWIARAASTGQSQQFAWQAKGKGGRLFWADVSIRVTVISARQVVLATLRDVTQRRAMEAQLRQALKLEAIGTLAGGVAHELNNLLQPIIMMTELVLAELPKGSRHFVHLSDVIDAGGKASEIVQRILAFGRVDEVSHSLLDIGTVAREAIVFIRTILPSSITLHVEIDDVAGMVRGDKTQLTQILINLASNARDAIGANVGTVWLSLSRPSVGVDVPHFPVGTMGAGDYAIISVRDNGAGMDDATAQRIFEPFFTTKGVGKGTGLGLSVTHGIVVGHGGAILVDSAVGHGTTFSICLPLAEPDEALALAS
jgi:two-component system cell cycle sensor histidine kinase/response regulator CckA